MRRTATSPTLTIAVPMAGARTVDRHGSWVPPAAKVPAGAPQCPAVPVRSRTASRQVCRAAVLQARTAPRAVSVPVWARAFPARVPVAPVWPVPDAPARTVRRGPWAVRECRVVSRQAPMDRSAARAAPYPAAPAHRWTARHTA
ncbi:hypothetical protein AB0G04_39285 [Actinoplanes sp. NPDC023801]|uniref:hypothetical protein n=1 Tax=Actinoplanes sp. NPDC023801 TaxID=3154595 RepID=UPI0033E57AE4